MMHRILLMFATALAMVMVAAPLQAQDTFRVVYGPDEDFSVVIPADWYVSYPDSSILAVSTSRSPAEFDSANDFSVWYISSHQLASYWGSSGYEAEFVQSPAFFYAFVGWATTIGADLAVPLPSDVAVMPEVSLDGDRTLSYLVAEDESSQVALIGVMQHGDGTGTGIIGFGSVTRFADQSTVIMPMIESVQPAPSIVAVECASNDEACFGVLATTAQGFTTEGFGTIGNPEAPIWVAVVSDPACSHCVDYHPTFVRLITDFAPIGEAYFVQFLVNWTGGDASTLANQAVYCAGEQGAYWQLLDAIYVMADSVGLNRVGVADLLRTGAEMGLDEGDMELCMNNNQSRRPTAEAINLAQRVGVTGTPSILFSYDGGVSWELARNREYSAVAEAIAAANE